MQKVLSSYMSAQFIQLHCHIPAAELFPHSREKVPLLSDWKMWWLLFVVPLNCCVVPRLNKLQTWLKQFVYYSFPVLNRRKWCVMDFLHQDTENFQQGSINLRNSNSCICTEVYLGAYAKERGLSASTPMWIKHWIVHPWSRNKNSYFYTHSLY